MDENPDARQSSDSRHVPDAPQTYTVHVGTALFAKSRYCIFGGKVTRVSSKLVVLRLPVARFMLCPPQPFGVKK